MKNDKNICLLGFSSLDEEGIKSLISANTNCPINWTSANNEALDGVVINSLFLSTTPMQKYIREVGCPVVSAYHNDSGAKLVQKEKVVAIDLRNSLPADLSVWLNALLSPQGDKQAEANLKIELTSDKKYSSDEQANSRYLELLETIKHKENVVIKTQYDNFITWILPAKNIVFINYSKDTVPSIEQWKWQYQKTKQIPDNAQQIKLDQWLFETLWQTRLSLEGQVNDTQYYQLLRWPQPLGKEGRSQVLRLAACAQAYPVNLNILHQKTSYEHERIRQFLFATLNVGYSKVVHERKKDTPKQETIIKSEETIAKRGLMRRLRQKLGL